MTRVAVVADSVSCLPPGLIKEYEIRIIPISLIADRKIYKDTDLTNEGFWKLFYSVKENITTIAPNPADFEAVFTDLSHKTDSIVCVVMSSKLSATYNSACQAQLALKQRLPDLNIVIIDSKTATGAEGFIVLETARAARVGKTLAETVKVAQAMIARVKFVAVLSTLKFLRRGGRAPKSALIGDWLKVKPVLSMTNGSGLVENPAKEMGMGKAIVRMLELADKHIDSAKPLHLIVHYSDNLDIAEHIKSVMTERYKCVEVYMAPLTPIMTSHSGPMVAAAFFQ
jgi:DegV family protein with EDD domain